MKVVLGVTGCIGAYKAALILRLLQKERAEVFPVMTKSATQFIAPLTLEKLSGHRVVTDLFADRDTDIEHISLARASDLLLVAPATANILGKFAAGIADDFLSTLYLSTTTPVIVAPAMNVEMWRHPATQANLAVLKSRGVQIIEPDDGYLACGEVGEGRLAEPEAIVAQVVQLLRPARALTGRKALVTAGPTVEDIDAVRFMSNRSSGKMGYAIAKEAARRGADVVLVAGPTELPDPPGLQVVHVRSAREMADAVFSRYSEVDVAVMAAAVSDYQAPEVFEGKMKKGCDAVHLTLLPTVDILKTLGETRDRQVLVGFAAEATNIREYARGKLEEKRADLIVANGIAGSSPPFGSDYNEVIFVTAGREEVLPQMRKEEIASELWDRIQSIMKLPPAK